MSKKGAFGGAYNHVVIKELRKELAIKSLMLAALVKHTGIEQPELEKISREYLQAQDNEMKSKYKNL